VGHATEPISDVDRGGRVAELAETLVAAATARFLRPNGGGDDDDGSIGGRHRTIYSIHSHVHRQSRPSKTGPAGPVRLRNDSASRDANRQRTNHGDTSHGGDASRVPTHSYRLVRYRQAPHKGEIPTVS
jgi:hypothetical protein